MGKNEESYRSSLARAFKECKQVLKQGGWLTIVFHNSSQSVWAALERAVRDAGFAVLGSQTFDKTHGTFKQFVSDNAVGYDVVLDCRQAMVQLHSLTTLKTYIPQFASL